MPSNSTNQSLTDSQTLESHTFLLIYSFSTWLTPQQEFDLTYTANQEVTFYILNVETMDFYHSLKMDGPVDSWHDASNIQAYLAKNPEQILFKTSSMEESIKYTPPSMVNNTLVCVNLSDNTVLVEFSGQINSTYAPQSRLLEVASITLSLGTIFVIPGSITFYKNRKTRKQLY
jgi:hypothetical protein